MAVSIVAVLFASSLSLLSNPSSEIPPEISPTPARTAYTPHATIFINGNAGFLGSNATTGITNGSGTAVDPYIIEGWDIAALTADGIEIRNASVHFTIRNCYVHDDATAYFGIMLLNCTNGILSGNNCSLNPYGILLWLSNNNTLINNTCSNNDNGIYLQSSSNNTLSNNTCSSNKWYGIDLSSSNSYNTLVNNTCSDNRVGMNIIESNHNTLSNNTCSSNNDYGIYLYSVSNNTLSNNNCSNNNRGIYIYSSSSYNTLINNTCSDNNVGIYLYLVSNNTLSNNNCSSNNNVGIWAYSSSNNTLFNNTCSDNIAGIDIYSSSHNTISNNTCSSNSQGIKVTTFSSNNVLSNNTFSSNVQFGIYLSGWSSNNTISWNQVCNNTFQGVYLYSGSNNRVWNNTFYHNNGSGDTYNQAMNQALDSGGINWWNSTNGYGNYWADWTTPDDVYRFGIVDLPYNITGTRHAKDYYPLTSPKVSAPPIPEFSNLIVPILGMILSVLLIKSRHIMRREQF